jgi:hypothetical protein
VSVPNQERDRSCIWLLRYRFCLLLLFWCWTLELFRQLWYFLFFILLLTTWCFLYNFKHNLKLKHMLYVFNIGMFIFQLYLKSQWHITDHKSNKQVGLSCLSKLWLPQCTGSHDLSTLYIILYLKENLLSK